MELFIAFIMTFSVLGLLSARFGVDSRDGIEDTHRGHARSESL
jgi:hypothetical protein